MLHIFLLSSTVGRSADDTVALLAWPQSMCSQNGQTAISHFTWRKSISEHTYLYRRSAAAAPKKDDKLFHVVFVATRIGRVPHSGSSTYH